MRKIIDLTGQKFGKLTAIKFIEIKNGRTLWEWKCDCGNTKIIDCGYVKRGYTKSCGCLLKQPDIIGLKFNRLTILKEVKRKYYKNKQFHRYVLCQCDCGTIKEQCLSSVKNGRIKSCGCLQFEKVQTRGRKNGHKYIFETDNRFRGLTHIKKSCKLGSIFYQMMNRCYRECNDRYEQYGGRGITVCDEWANDFSKFQKWALENGWEERKGKDRLTIERKDVNGNYSPDNCTWLDIKHQNWNKRNTVYIYYKSKKIPLVQFAEDNGFSWKEVYLQLRYYKLRNKKKFDIANSIFEVSINENTKKLEFSII